MKKEALDTDPQSMDNRSLSAIAGNPNHPLHTHAKSELDRRKMTREEKDPEEYDKEGSMMKGQLRQICSANEKLMSMVKDDDNLPEWVQSKVTKATDYIRSVRDYLESEKMDESTKVSATEDQAAIDAFLKKGGKITKVPAAKAQGAHGSTDLERNVSGQLGSGDTNRFKTRKKIKSMGESIQLESEKMEESTKVAATNEVLDTPKAMQSYKDKAKYSADRAANSAAAKILRGKDKDGNRADHSAEVKTRDKRAKGLKMADRNATKKTVKALRKEESVQNEVTAKTLSNYIRKSAADAGKPRQDVRTQDKRIGGQKMADDKLRKMDGKGSAAKVAATKEANTYVGQRDQMKITDRKPHPDGGHIVTLQTKAGKTIKRHLKNGKVKDIKEAQLDELTAAEKKLVNQMYDKKGNLTPMGKKVMNHGKRPGDKGYVESVNELSKDTMQSYWDKTKSDDAFSGTRKANNRLKGAINVTTKLDRLKKMVKK